MLSGRGLKAVILFVEQTNSIIAKNGYSLFIASIVILFLRRVVSSGGYETSAIHSKIHSKKIKYAVQSKAMLPTIATSKLEQIWKSDVVLYPENL